MHSQAGVESLERNLPFAGSATEQVDRNEAFSED